MCVLVATRRLSWALGALDLLLRPMQGLGLMEALGGTRALAALEGLQAWQALEALQGLAPLQSSDRLDAWGLLEYQGLQGPPAGLKVSAPSSRAWGHSVKTRRL